jgi:hypothetical protein
LLYWRLPSTATFSDLRRTPPPGSSVTRLRYVCITSLSRALSRLVARHVAELSRI